MSVRSELGLLIYMVAVLVRSKSVLAESLRSESVSAVSMRSKCVGCVFSQQVREKEVIQEKEQLHLQIAEMSILARIKQEEGEPTEQQEGM